MLQSMREKTQGLFALAIAVVISLTFMLWGIQNYLHTGGGAQVIAKVNGKKITQAQENIEYEQFKHSKMLQQGQGFSLDQKTQAKVKENIRQQLIEKEVLSQAIAKMGFGVGQGQLGAIVAGLPIFQVDGKFSIDRFQQLTERFFYSRQVFFEDIKHSFLQTQLKEGIASSSFDLPSEVEFAKKMFKQRRDFGYFVVSPERFAKTTKIDSADIQKYYEQHQSEFTVPEKISLQYLELSSDVLKSEIDTSEEQLKQYYQDHISSFSTPKKWHVMMVSLPLLPTANAKAVDDAQKKLMQIKESDDLTKVKGAKTNKVWLTKNNTGPDFVEQLNKLSIGQISKPFRTREGYALGKVLAVQPEEITPYKKVAAKVKQAYEQHQLAHVFSEVTDRLTDLTYANPDSLEPAAMELGLKVKTTGLVANDESVKEGVLANNKFIKTAFSEAVLRHGYNSSPVEIESGRVVVLRVKDQIPEVLQPLDKVSSVIEEKLKAKAMQEKAEEFSRKLVEELQNGKIAAELVKENNFVWHMITDASSDRSQDVKLVKAAFDLNKPSLNKASATMVELHDGYAVLQLMKVYDSPKYVETKKETSFLKSLPRMFGKFDYEILVEGLKNDAKIIINK